MRHKQAERPLLSTVSTSEAAGGKGAAGRRVPHAELELRMFCGCNLRRGMTRKRFHCSHVFRLRISAAPCLRNEYITTNKWRFSGNIVSM